MGHQSIQVWLLSSDQDVTPDVLDLLNDDERSAISRFLRERDRCAFTVTRAALRCLLSDQICVSPKDVRLVRNTWGKPRLADSQHRPGLDFSVSHAGDLSVIAISHCGSAGVDIERRRQVPEKGRIAADVFDGATASTLGRQPADLQDDVFLRLWTAGEACLKAKGLGFAGAGGHAPVKLLSNTQVQIEIDESSNGSDCGRLALHSLDLPSDYLGSLVVQHSALGGHESCTPDRTDIAHLLSSVS